MLGSLSCFDAASPVLSSSGENFSGRGDFSLGVNIGSDSIPPTLDCLVGLVVKASASRAEDPGFESRLRRVFFGVESYQ